MASHNSPSKDTVFTVSDVNSGYNIGGSRGTLASLSETSVSVQNLFNWKAGKSWWSCDPMKKSSRRWQLTKMMVLTMIPIITLAALASNNLTTVVKANKASLKIRQAISFGRELGNFLHFLQSERDMSTLYLSTISPLSRQALTDTYPETDAALAKLNGWLADSGNLVLEFNSKESFQRYLDTHRRDLYISTSTMLDEIEFYSNSIKFFINWLYETLGKFRGSGQSWTSLVGFQLLIVSKEDVGIERTLGAVYFSTGKFTDDNHFIDYLERAYRAKGNFEASWQYAPEIKEFHDELMGDLPGDVVRSISDMRETIRQNISVDASWHAANYWYANMTSYMDILLLIQERVSDNILQVFDDGLSGDLRNLAVVILVLLLVCFIGPTVLFLVTKLTSSMQMFASSLVVQSKSLQRERKRAVSLLYRLLPRAVAQQLKKNERVPPESFKEATVFFSDIVGFTSICSKSSPLQVTRMLNLLYLCFDSRIEKYDVHKVETIGDAYMVVSGVPRRNGQEHAGHIATLSLDLTYHVSCLKLAHLPGFVMRLRIGIHSGPVVAGIVGTKMPRYCLFGNTVNIAERLEGAGEPNRIHVSKETYDILMKLEGYYLSKRGLVELQGKGSMYTFWLNGKDGFDPETLTPVSTYTPSLNVPSCSIDNPNTDK